VIAKAGAAADAYAKDGEQLGIRLESAVKASGSALVGQALVSFATQRMPDLTAVSLATANVLTGAAQASNAYAAGDEQMAAAAQWNAAHGQPSTPITTDHMQ
jgi:hypothetical protein